MPQQEFVTLKLLQNQIFIIDPLMNSVMNSVPKYSDTLLKILKQMLQDFSSVSQHFANSNVKGLKSTDPRIFKVQSPLLSPTLTQNKT